MPEEKKKELNLEESGKTELSGSRVEVSIDTSDDDMFDDAFGEDEEKKAAKERMKEKAKELESKLSKEKAKEENALAEGEGKKETPNEDELDDEDDSDEDNEDETDDEENGEPQLFGVKEVDKNGKVIEESDEEPDEDNEENDDDGDIAEEEEDDDLGEEERRKDDELDERLGRKKKKSFVVGGASKDAIIGPEDEEEHTGTEGPDLVEPSSTESAIQSKTIKALEKSIIKSVIKNKAQKSAKTETAKEDDLLKEDGVKEEGISEETLQEESDTYDPTLKIKPKLEFLMSDKGNAFIGRKKSVLKKYGEEVGLFIGRVHEEDMNKTNILLDGLNPHVVFACGARGTGKSYVLGVLAEELAIKNKNIGLVVVDPIGVFWSMKHPNKEDKELELLADWELMPRGLDNIKAFIPVGMVGSVPKSTYDNTFAIQPAMLTAEDWCLTFGIERFSPTGLLLDKAIANVKQGYTNLDGKALRGKENTFSLEDLIVCFETDAELNDRERGYKADSIRALVSRFDSAKTWGIFDKKGTPLSILSRAGQMTILDTSFLEDNVSALVVGILARRILQARKLSTRREAAGKFADTSMEDLVELNVPPTWLFIDEAHTLIPGGNQKTPASNALVEYVKQGRRPGCSLVFATQQPSAIDPKVLSQLDIIMVHKLVFDDDIKSITKRSPSTIPAPYKKPGFVKNLTLGVALVGDSQETTSRAFVMNIRPRMSQHEGRDAETVEVNYKLEKGQVEKLAVNIILKQLEKDPAIAIETIEQTLDSLNHTYKEKLNLQKILEDLKKKGVVVGEDSVSIPGEDLNEELTDEIENGLGTGTKNIVGGASKESLLKEHGTKEGEEFEDYEEEFEHAVELVALAPSIAEPEARKRLAKLRLKKKLLLFGDEEIIDRLSLKYSTIYKVKYNYFSQKDAFQVGEAYIDSITGEFIHDDKGKIKESRGLKKISTLNESESIAYCSLAKKRTLEDLAKVLNMEKGNAKRVVDSLIAKKLVNVTKQKEIEVYSLKEAIDLPPTPLHAILPSIGKRPITELESVAAIQPNIDQKEIPDLLKKLWGNVIVKEINELYLPVWEGILKKKTGEERIARIDAINGNILS